MNCPHCTKQINNKLISKHLASKGGKADKKGKRDDLKKGGSTYIKRWGDKK
jgi:hypothetical protein